TNVQRIAHCKAEASPVPARGTSSCIATLTAFPKGDHTPHSAQPSIDLIQKRPQIVRDCNTIETFIRQSRLHSKQGRTTQTALPKGVRMAHHLKYFAVTLMLLI